MHPESLRDRLTRFLLLCSALGSVSLVVIVTQRLSDDALSLALGVGIGIVALLIPLVAVASIAYLAVRWTEARTYQRPAQAPGGQPQILIVPQPAALPAVQYPTPTIQYAPAGAERRFAVIGDES